MTEAKHEKYGDSYDSNSFERETSKAKSHVKHDNSLGEKTVGYFASFVYVINQIFGPGVVAIPIVYQQAGWELTILSLVIFCIISSFATTFLVEAMSIVPGNAFFDKRIEYSICMRYYFGRVTYYIFQFFLNVCLASLTVSSIIITVQAYDELFVFIFGKSCAFEFAPRVTFYCGDANQVNDWFSGDGVWTISLGYLVGALTIIPQSVVTLDGNIIFQYMSFFGLVLINVWLSFSYCYQGLNGGNLLAKTKNFQQVVSVMLTAWSYVMVIPSWVNEKRDEVSVNKVIWYSATISCVCYICISGIFAAGSLSTGGGDNILQSIVSTNYYGLPDWFVVITKLCAYLFSLFIIMPGTPVFQITIRYNLYVGEVCGKFWSYFWSAIAPWLISFIFVQGPLFANFLTWTALIFGSIVNFIVPLALYLRCLQVRPDAAFIDELSQERFESINDEEADTASLLHHHHEERVIVNDKGEKEEEMSESEDLRMRYMRKDEIHHALPRFMRKPLYTKIFIYFLIVVTTILVVGQIGFDLVETFVYHQSMVSS